VQSTSQATEHKIGRSTVRIHGTPDREKIEAAAIRFVTKVLEQKNKQRGG